MSSAIITITGDPLVLRNLRRLCEQMALEFKVYDSLDPLRVVEEPPRAVVVDLEVDGALDFVANQSQQWRSTLFAGFVSLPSIALWQGGEKAGCHLVSTRGALANQLRQRLLAGESPSTARRIRLFSTPDIAGRLGVVLRINENPAGPVAIYHIGGVFYAAKDICPHAGARLSEGELNLGTAVITCPKHGSQFNLANGLRVRGPADLGIETYRVIVEDRQVFLQLD